MKKIILFLLLMVSVTSCSSEEESNISNDSEIKETVQLETEKKKIIKSGKIENGENQYKNLLVEVIGVKTVTSYDVYGETITTDGAQVVTLKVTNTGKEPYDLNSGLGLTEGWIQLEMDGFKYNTTDITTRQESSNPGESWEKDYIFDTKQTEVVTGSKILFNKTNLKKELELSLD